MIQFDPDTQSYYEVPDSDSPVNGLHPPAAPSAPFVQPSLDPNAGQFHGIDYWNQQGNPAFDAGGQLNPGFSRVNNGYDYAAPASGPGPLTPPSASGGWMPQFTAPKFNAPAPFAFPDFKAPTLDEARQEPGFEFAMEQGRKALENSAAGKGTLRTGGTLKDIIGYGQKLGEQNYGNVFGRAKDVYGLNRGNAADTYATNYGVSRDVFDRTYQGAKDEFAPKQREAELNQTQSFQEWLAKLGAAQNLVGAGAD